MICCYIQADVSHRIDSRLKRCRGTFPVCLRVSGFCWLKLALGTVYWMTRARWRPLLPVGVTGPEWRRPASMFWFRELLCRLIGVVSWFFSWFYCFDSETHHRKMGVFHRAPGTGINSEFISPPPHVDQIRSIDLRSVLQPIALTSMASFSMATVMFYIRPPWTQTLTNTGHLHATLVFICDPTSCEGATQGGL